MTSFFREFLTIVHVIFIIIVHVFTAASLLQQTILIIVYFVDCVTVNKYSSYL